MMAPPWDLPGLDARLCRLHARGLPFSRIADALNAEFNTTLTRNACIGRAHRLLLPVRPPPPPPKVRPKIKLVPKGVTFAALRHDGCRWPYGELHERAKLFCGRPVCQAGGPWCATHYRTAYNLKGSAA